MHLTSDGHEIIYIKDPGKKVTIPPYDIKGMGSIFIGLIAILEPNLNIDWTISFGFHILRSAYISFGERGTFQELPMSVSVP